MRIGKSVKKYSGRLSDSEGTQSRAVQLNPQNLMHRHNQSKLLVLVPQHGSDAGIDSEKEIRPRRHCRGIYIIKIAQFDFLSALSRVRSAIDRARVYNILSTVCRQIAQK